MSPSALEGLISCLEENHLIAGLSNSFHDLREMHDVHRQAVLAMNGRAYAPKDAKLFSYQRYGWYHMLELANDDGSLSWLQLDAYLRMKQFDDENGTLYSETIKIFLSSGLSESKTARLMNVHRNTIDYRLSRARELFGIDLSDGTELFLLSLSFRISDFFSE